MSGEAVGHARGSSRCPPARLAGQAGQGMVEYGLILVLVALVVVGALMAVGNQVPAIFNNVVAKLQTT